MHRSHAAVPVSIDYTYTNTQRIWSQGLFKQHTHASWAESCLIVLCALWCIFRALFYCLFLFAACLWPYACLLTATLDYLYVPVWPCWLLLACPFSWYTCIWLLNSVVNILFTLHLQGYGLKELSLAPLNWTIEESNLLLSISAWFHEGTCLFSVLSN